MHCWGGRGRAGTIASCFLAACYGLSADEILARIQRAFDTRQDGGESFSMQLCSVFGISFARQLLARLQGASLLRHLPRRSLSAVLLTS